MHYANGRAARIGDVVKGKGYNVKHEIIGRLIFANPASTACNCQVAYIGGYTAMGRPLLPNGELTSELHSPLVPIGYSVEYGQLDAFVALDPATGEILLPEVENTAPKE